MVSAAVDGRVAARVEVDEVDEQLAALDAHEAVPVPEHFTAAVTCTGRQLAAVYALAALTSHMHTVPMFIRNIPTKQYKLRQITSSISDRDT